MLTLEKAGFTIFASSLWFTVIAPCQISCPFPFESSLKLRAELTGTFPLSFHLQFSVIHLRQYEKTSTPKQMKTNVLFTRKNLYTVYT